MVDGGPEQHSPKTREHVEFDRAGWAGPGAGSSSGRRGELQAVGARPLSVLKRIRTAEREQAYNKSVKTFSRSRVKKLMQLVEAAEGEEAVDVAPIDAALSEAYAALDRAWSKGSMHKNTVARKKSRINSAVKKLKVSKGLLAADE